MLYDSLLKQGIPLWRTVVRPEVRSKLWRLTLNMIVCPKCFSVSMSPFVCTKWVIIYSAIKILIFPFFMHPKQNVKAVYYIMRTSQKPETSSLHLGKEIIRKKWKQPYFSLNLNRLNKTYFWKVLAKIWIYFKLVFRMMAVPINLTKIHAWCGFGKKIFSSLKMRAETIQIFIL